MANNTQTSKLIKYLPRIYQRSDTHDDDLVDRLLLAFEEIIFRCHGDEDGAENEFYGIEEVLDRVHSYWDPDKTPPEFLSWLAMWLAIPLKKVEPPDQEESQQRIPSKKVQKNNRNGRDLLKKIITFYQHRGTPDGIKDVLEFYLKGLKISKKIDLKIHEFMEPFCIGKNLKVGENTVIGNGCPFFFEIRLQKGELDPLEVERVTNKITEIVDREKPAHTYYDIIIET